MLGSSAHTVELGGNLNVGQTNTVSYLYATNLFASGGVLAATVNTNATHAGTNIVSGTWGETITIIDTLANGDNDLAPTTATIKIKPGPTAAYNINGITNWYNGRIVTLINACSAVLTLKHESGTGLGGTPANRIMTYNAADATVTTNGVAKLKYDSDSSRWRIESIYPQ